MKLVIAEKPSVAADIAKALGIANKQEGVFVGTDCLVAAARGHLVSLQPAQDPGWAMEMTPCIPAEWVTVPIKGAEKPLQNLKKLVGRSDVVEVVNACDAGREGELIFRLVIQHLRVKKPMTRMWLQTMTNEGIKTAYETRQPASQFDALSDAARARSIADWIVGINLSIVLTKGKMIEAGELVTAGRVQTPTLALLVDRERAIETFVPVPFFEVVVDLDANGVEWSGKAVAKREPDTVITRFANEADANRVVQRIASATTTDVTDTTSQQRKNAPLLFDLTTLQRECNVKFGYSAAQTLELAQELYEKYKVTTYPRTNSQYLPADYVAEATSAMRSIRGRLESHVQQAIDSGWISSKSRLFDGAKVTDHFAIIPTGRTENIEGDAGRVFELICERFVAAFYPPVIIEHVERSARIGDQEIVAVGRRVLDAGWWAVTGESLDAAKALRPLVAGSPHQVVSATVHKGATTPPDYYTDATLLAAMARGGSVSSEENADAVVAVGLGTPATRASTIEGLLSAKRQYVRREKKWLRPTGKGVKLVERLRVYGVDSITNAATTSRWEGLLASVEAGKLKRETFLDGIAQQTNAMVKALKAEAVVEQIEPATLSAVRCRCGEMLAAHAEYWKCDACKLKLWRTVATRELDEGIVEELCSNGTTRRIDGFRSKTGKLFSASLQLREDGKVGFVFDGDTR